MPELKNDESVLAIDPGNFRSAFCQLTGARKLVDFGLLDNGELREKLYYLTRMNRPPDKVACEMVASYGMAVGASVFDTCVFIGELMELIRGYSLWEQVTRLEVKLAICRSPKANDSNIRAALIDLFGEPGTKKNPGPTYGISKDVWAALALAETVRSGNYRPYVPVHRRIP